MTFSQNWALGKIDKSSQALNTKTHTSVHCMPFYAIYKAIGRKDIDLFVLDIEGHEMEILETIPWDRVNILVWNKYCKNPKIFDAFDFRLWWSSSSTVRKAETTWGTTCSSRDTDFTMEQKHAIGYQRITISSKKAQSTITITHEAVVLLMTDYTNIYVLWPCT